MLDILVWAVFISLTLFICFMIYKAIIGYIALHKDIKQFEKINADIKAMYRKFMEEHDEIHQ